MLAFEEARAQLLALGAAGGTEVLNYDQALGRVLAEPLLAPGPQPAEDTSAMDGYAFAHASLAPCGPYILPVHGESRAGHPLTHLSAGTACRIFTGALLPRGADTVLLQENAERSEAGIRFSHVPFRGEHVRLAGSDLGVGATAITAGSRLTAYHLGLLAALDCTQVRVHQRPKVALLLTGDELRDPGAPSARGSIPESNGIVLQALLEQAGAHVVLRQRVQDDADATRAALERAAEAADLVLSVGGVSVGDHDVVRLALQALGAELAFWKVRIKPGKPLAVARLGSKLLVGLPGNPVSAQVTCVLFVLPLIRKLQGRSELYPEFRAVPVRAALKQSGGRTTFYRARLGADGAYPFPRESSGSVASLAGVDLLLMADGNRTEFSAGCELPALHLLEAIHG